jgi:NAD(P)-dependent dehydrogenase (short-subunit alcohol dehydrogenase family)
MARRTALIVGADDPADSIASGLADAGWVVLRIDDDDLMWDDHTIAAAFPDLDGLDLVVHARYPAASRRRGALMDLTDDDWRIRADEPFEATIRLARSAHPYLAGSAGTIVFLVPLMASAGGEGFAPMATAAEGARLLAKSLAKTWGHDHIRAHAITLDPSAFLAPDEAAGMAEANSLHDPPLGRVPDLSTEVAPIVNALTTDDFTSLLGASLVVDGGLWMPG